MKIFLKHIFKKLYIKRKNLYNELEYLYIFETNEDYYYQRKYDIEYEIVCLENLIYLKEKKINKNWNFKSIIYFNFNILYFKLINYERL
jgi:hypothetical protein